MTDDPRIDPADLRNVRFPGSSRRYDARSVDQFLETVAARIAATNVLVDELREQLAAVQAAPADAPSAPPAPVPVRPPSDLAQLDDDALVQLVGEETASVLASARRAAEEIRSKAEESAARMIREATADADQLTGDARRRSTELTSEAEQALAAATAEAEEAAARIRADAAEEAERTTTASRAAAEEQQEALDARRAEVEAEVEAVLEQAREEGRGMVAEAREVRHRILEDLQRRRDAAREHIERLLAGRERLLAAYGLVRENLDDITGQLADALPVPAEPELPDGFVGIVGHDRDDDAPAADDAPEDDAAGVEVPDDTVAPRPAPPEEEPVEDAPADAEPDDATDEAPVPAVVAEEDEPVEAAVGGADGVGAADAPGEPAEDEPVEVRADEPEQPGDVDALFARLRAEREESVAKAQEVLGEDAPEVDESAAAEPAVDAAPAEAEPAGGADDAAAEADPDRVPAELLAAEVDLARRAEVLQPLEDALNRALKRRLADEQNELLDLLRRSGTTDPAELLTGAEEQVAGYARIAEKHLAAAATAGAGGAGGPDVAALAEALGRTIVEPFRRRVERAAADVDGDADELDERLRALYREWKVQHVAPAADDALLTAYAHGTLHAAAGGTVRWRIDPTQGPCPDAQDNALAGAVAAGEAFPTGDACPQAHPGCHCLLVAEPG